MEFLQSAQNQYLSYMNTFQQLMQRLWSQSKFCRITALVTGSITGYLSFRYLYIKSKRKYYGLPPGMVGMPVIGNVWNLLSVYSVCHLHACSLYKLLKYWCAFAVCIDNRPELAVHCSWTVWRCHEHSDDGYGSLLPFYWSSSNRLYNYMCTVNQVEKVS